MNRIKKIIVMVSFLMTSAVFAQPGTTISAENALVGALNVPVTVSYLGTNVGSPNGVVGFQAKFTYDNTKVQVNATGLDACSAIYTCTDDGSSINMVAFTFPSSELPSTSITIGFDMLAGAIVGDVVALNLIPGPTTVNVDGEEYVDFGANPVAIVGSSNGSITVVSGPQPAWSSSPVGGSTLTFPSVIAGGANPTQSITVDNVGAATSTLTGTCALSGATDAELTITGGAAISLLDTAGTSDVTLACDATAAGTFTGSLECTHNGDAAGDASPVSYPLTCTITPPGQAQYASTPAASAVIEMTTGTGILVGSASPTTSIAITNPAPNATDLDLSLETCTYAGNAAISVTSTDPLITTLAPQSAATATVNFSCDTAAAGNFTGTYSCPYSTDGAAGPEGTATYTVNCDVRAAESAGSPADGTSSNASITAPPGGSTSNTVVAFSETNNEGVDITNLSCIIPAGDFAVVTGMPATIPAGGSIGVDVSFTDPGVPGPYADVMTCTYTDSSGVLATVTVNLSGAVRAIVVPTMSWLGYVAMMLGLLLVGSFGFRRRA